MNNDILDKEPAGSPASITSDQAGPPGKKTNWLKVTGGLISTVILGVIVTSISSFLSAFVRHVPVLVLLLSVFLVALVAGWIALMRYLFRNAQVEPRVPRILLVMALVLAVAGVVIGAVIGLKLAKRNPPPPPPPPSLSIASPAGVIKCTSSAPQCQFQVSGHVTPEPASGVEIFVLVYPINPTGDGWYVQLPPANIQTGGNWSQAPSLIGSTSGGAPARNGDTFQVEAVEVSTGATYRGSTLPDISTSEKTIPDWHQITGLVAESPIVQLTVIRQ